VASIEAATKGNAKGKAIIPSTHPRVIPNTPAYVFILLFFSFNSVFRRFLSGVSTRLVAFPSS
jgi:hypothetical protein